ncbi:MAG: mce related family protein [Proteobacteria bacterium]|nr:mce related family protein [Pseudomonadota bacterium]
MSQRSNPTLIGAFVFGAMLLIVAGIFLFTGNNFLVKKPRYVLYFEGSVYGLQVGAPVVFRGVQIGSVQRIDLRYDSGRRQLVIPVTVEGLPKKLLDVNGQSAEEEAPDPTELISRGLRAQLATQSLLTGQLYIELDFHPDKPLVYRSPNKRLPEIPTIASPVQEIANKLQQIDVEGLINDVAAIASTARSFVRSPELAGSLKTLDATLNNLKSVSAKLDQRIEPLALNLDKTLSTVSRNMDGVGVAANKLAGVADQASAPLLSLKQAADELRTTTATLNELAGEGAPALYNASQTLKELKEAARALQELSDTLDRQPNSLLFGKKPTPRQEPQP